MTEWAVVGVIVTLVGLVAVLAKPIASYSASAAKTAVLVDTLYERVEEEEKRREDCIKEINGELKDHDKRITKLEYGKGA